MSAEKRRPSIFWLLAAIALPPASILWRFDIRGKLPETGPFILAPNHNSEIDPLLIGIAVWKLGRAPRFMAKESLFRVPVIGALLKWSGQIPVTRDPRQGNQSAIDAARHLVETGSGVIVYPEGTLTREPDLWPMRGKNGAIRVALAENLPVYPCAQWGAEAVLPRYGKFRPTFRARIAVRIGEPMDLSQYLERRTSASAMNAATAELMGEITGLLETVRGATAPAEQWDPAKHGQTEHGRRLTGDGPAAS
ncbi:1-acyl-sn-glycerol-3-phosphate acyltransferase [Pseudoclavibacter chungangensis]|uniref:1-acyl-sn-glycerol-3-phosphate acyltransferase n=1 Tax=Pseudoclavibacter chungangensis TaxID=587635 RepID=A0A7J5C1G7_9MICO|nr:lysophospholipid acyltransferase family protein [Pseudoclavibacter chungangensis]KAB1659641.1 1-acyl-sn-glycerol-3-phosphate acyltransferase [Pseudoclavibacter chungangensis]NYJ67476.1 1-acyl-sn-glycerol-3-phosphate acyltransferase [Pseudoclavibacter chungangensis]